MASGVHTIFNVHNKFIFGTLVFGAFTFIALSKSTETKKKKIFIAVIAPYLFLIVPFIVLSFNDTINALPSNLSIPFGFFLGLILFRLKSSFNKIFIGLFFLLATLFLGLYIYPRYSHYLHFRNITGEVTSAGVVNISFDGSTLTNNDFKDSTTLNQVKVLDFWQSSCGHCFRGFPVFDSLSIRFKDNDKLSFYAINKMVKRDSLPLLKARLNKYNYNFEFLFPRNNDFNERFPFDIVYPSYMILNESNEVVFYGDLENIANYLEENF